MIAVVILLAGGGSALYLVLQGKEETPRPSPRPSRPVAAPPTSTTPNKPPTSAPTGDPLKRLDSRRNDPQPLTLDELFAKKKFHVGDRTYKRAARREDTNCSKAVDGRRLQQALRAGGCTQVLRASYIGQRGKVISTIGIANLKDAKAARAAVDAAGAGHNYVVPLPGSGPAKRLGSGLARIGLLARGHYLVMSWVEYADGHRPSSADDKRLVRHNEEVAEKTIVEALTFRMLIGRPKP